jgi:hypothetical protein
MEAIFTRYGSIGWLVDSRDDLFELICTLDPIEFARRHSTWINNLRAIREARTPEALAESYATSISMTGESQPNTIPDVTQPQ